MDGVYDICGYMTGDRGVMTHQLPLASDAIKPDIEAQHPWIREIQPAGEFDGEAQVIAFVAEMAAKYGEWHELEPAPQSWGRHDPLQDFANLYPDTPVIAIALPEDEP